MDSEPKATTDESVPLTRVPAEILSLICSYLSNKDIKALRLAGPTICHAVPPRFTRVFLSPNPRNLEVFCAIASHPTFRLGVREIVYDDACLEDPRQQLVLLNGRTFFDAEEENMELEAFMNRNHPDAGPPDARPLVTTRVAIMCAWFGTRRERSLRELHGRNANDTGNAERQEARQKQKAAETPLVKSFRYYMDLFLKQDTAIQANEDFHALMEGIEAFPALERITVTPATHGYLYTPLYYTPMIRSFPYGFNYAIPRGWPTMNNAPVIQINPWVTGPGYTDCNVSTEKARWRGLVLVIKTLAERIRKGQRAVPELVLDVHSLHTGVSPYMLTQDCEEYQNMALILQQTSFRRLDLPILICAIPAVSFDMLRNGKLKSLLSHARHLEHFRLRGDGQVHPPFTPQARPFLPLQSLLPVDAWPQLRHFGLSKFVVRIPDLVEALRALPPTLRSVELSFLEFDDATGRRANHAMLLEAMKTGLDWAGREPAARPQVTLGMAKVKNNVDGRGLWFSKEIGEYLYDDKTNPFGWHRDVLLPGVGWLADEYDEDFARPYVGYKDYRALWYCEES